MPRRSNPDTIIYEYAAQTDVERCARALVRLLLWEPPADAPATAQAAACGDVSLEEPAESDETL